MQELAVYIHIPFCRSKCAYCDFYSITETNFIPKFLSALLKEIKIYRQHPPLRGFSYLQQSTPSTFCSQQLEEKILPLTSYNISSIYFGGGTPSLLPPQKFPLVLQHLSKLYPLTGNAEITIEANPDSLSELMIEQLLYSGINRISLGVQSFNDQELRRLGRIHTAKQAEATIQAILKTDIKNWNIDLIFAIPGQSLNDWQETLKRTLRYRPPHISIYGLSYEAGTALTQAVSTGKVQKCDEELERQMYLYAMETLCSAGYEHYEISNWALTGYRCRHNQTYWDGTSYLGLGPAAHSFFSPFRWSNIADVDAYVQLLNEGKAPIDYTEQLAQSQLKAEAILLGFRRREGINLWEWQTNFSEDLLQSASSAIDRLGGVATIGIPFTQNPTGKLLLLHNNCLALSQQGLLLYDFICKEFYNAMA